jgi:signal transduction histidine kinase
MSEKTIRVLLVEDNSADAVLLQEMFRKESVDSFQMTHLSRMTDAEAHLLKNQTDVVLLDMGLPDAGGLDTVRRAHAAAPDVPTIVLTGLDDEVLAAEAIKAGAVDYLIKGQIENRALPRMLRHTIERQRLQTEADHAKAQELQIKDEFLSHVSHELRSPVFAIYQFVTILLDKLAGEVNPQQKEYLDIVLRNVVQLQSMIEDLLEVTRVQGGKLAIDQQSASAVDAVEYAVKTLLVAATAKQISLSATFLPGLPPVWADPKRVRQILIILLDNAIKFTPANGEVRVRVHATEPGFLTLEVADTGAGISPEMTERVFERLYQISEPGTAGRKGLGLGLHICKELVTRQGGQIRALNTPGEGATMVVTLPLFSLATVITRPFSTPARGPREVTLIVAKINSKLGWYSEEVCAETSHAIRETLQRCLHCEQDMLLPRMEWMAPATGSETFFILTMTGSAKAETLVASMLEKLGSSENLEFSDLNCSISHRPLAVEERQIGESKDIYLERSAAILEEAMLRAISSTPSVV